MINRGQIKEILSLYAKHGWILRRVLLSDEMRVNLTDTLADLFGAAEIVSAPLNALWFSRASKSGEAWEIRHLSETPFALVEVFPPETDNEMREERLDELQTRLLEKTSKLRKS